MLLNIIITEAAPLFLIHVPPVPVPFHDLKARKCQVRKARPATQYVSFAQGPSLIISDGSQHETMLKTKHAVV